MIKIHLSANYELYIIQQRVMRLWLFVKAFFQVAMQLPIHANV